MHDVTGLPSRCTVQAPHAPRSQTSLVPVKRESIAQRFQQRHSRFDLERRGLAVDIEFDGRGLGPELFDDARRQRLLIGRCRLERAPGPPPQRPRRRP